MVEDLSGSPRTLARLSSSWRFVEFLGTMLLGLSFYLLTVGWILSSLSRKRLQMLSSLFAKKSASLSVWSKLSCSSC